MKGEEQDVMLRESQGAECAVAGEDWEALVHQAGAGRLTPLTWAQYWDLAAAMSSFNTGWD